MKNTVEWKLGKLIRNLFVKWIIVLMIFYGGLLIMADQIFAKGFSFHVLDVDQGLCVVLESEGHYMLYDGGGSAKSSFVVSYLKNHDISQLDYIVASHYDADHISGLVGVLYNFPCSIFMGPDYETDTEIYRSLQNALSSAGIVVTHPKQGDTYQLGMEDSGVSFQFVTPDSLAVSPNNDNDYSIGVRLLYKDPNGKEESLIVCGDAGWTSETYMVFSDEEGIITLDSDIYIASHHGSSDSSSVDFLRAVTPEYAIISCGLNNTYGHPSEETLTRLKDTGCKLYRTDKQGTIDGICSEEGIFFAKSDTDDWSAGIDNSTNSDSQIQTESIQENVSNLMGEEITYVCNKSSRKFHRPDCPGIEQMSPQNRLEVNWSREELIDDGYSPCGWCQP